MEEKEKCPRCGSENTKVNVCVYWTVHPDTSKEYLTLENSDDGIHINSYSCDDCEERY